MDHPLHSKFHECLFEVANALLTVPRAVGNLAGSPILQLWTKSKGAQLTGRVLMTTILIHERPGKFHK